MGNTKIRESNIELLRNISMFMILIIHANFVSLPHIQYNELTTDFLPSFTRFFIESLGIVAVNVFVFISGWFGINTNTKRVWSFIYLVLFFLGGGGILFILLGKASFSIEWLLDVFQLSRKDWFIKSYFVLMIIAPILNNYCRTADEKTQRYVMLSFFLFESVYGWVMGGSRFFVDGYGPLHFIGLYITAQYVRNQLCVSGVPCWIKKIFEMPKWADLMFFLLLVTFNTAIIIVGSLYFHKVEPFHKICYAYSNPLNILGALYLLLFFSKIKMPYIKLVNWLGASSFAVYLFHGEGTIRNQFFTPQIQYIYDSYSSIGCIALIFLFLCIIYLISVLIDQLRILSWKKIWSWADNKKLDVAINN